MSWGGVRKAIIEIQEKLFKVYHTPHPTHKKSIFEIEVLLKMPGPLTWILNDANCTEILEPRPTKG